MPTRREPRVLAARCAGVASIAAAAWLLWLSSGPASEAPPPAAAQAPEDAILLPVALVGSFGPAPVPVVRPSATSTAPLEPTATGTLPPSPTGSPVPTPVRRPRHGRVSGSVYAAPDDRDRIAVPGVTIRLVSLDTFEAVAETTTDFHGTFHFRPLPTGAYGLCWEGAGFPGECAAAPVDLAGVDSIVQPIRIHPEPGVIHGRVTLQGDEACHMFDPARGIYVGTTVQLLAADGWPLRAPVWANAVGEYILPVAPPDRALRVVAICEAGMTESNVAEVGDAPRRLDLVFDNDRPTLDGIEVLVEGGGTSFGPPGAVVEVAAVARDDDGDPLTFRWRPHPGSGELDSASGPSARWRLPDAEGVHALDLLVADGRGGFARGSVRIEARAGATARFAGRVVDAETGEGLAGAIVRVSMPGAEEGTAPTAEGRSGDGGRFDLAAIMPAAEPVVLYVHRPGYAPLFDVRDGEASGATLPLQPLAGQAVDPSAPVTLVDQRPAVIRARQPGARVELPPDSLAGIVDGVRPTGMITGTGSGPIIIRGGHGGGGTGFPPEATRYGRSEGLDREGTPRHLDGFGAVSLAFHDAEGRAYAPRPGTVLGLSVPVSATVAISAPTTAPIWFLDGRTGYWWDTHGRAELVETPDGPAYVGSATVPDSPASLVEQIYQIALPDGFGLTCVRVQPDVTVRPGTTLRAEVRYGPTLVAAYQQPIVQGQALYPFLQIPKASSLRLHLLDTQGRRIPLATRTVALGTRPALPGEGAANIPPPYAACGTPIPLGIALPADVAVDASGEPVFLTGFGFPDYSSLGITYADATTAYYDALDPGGDRSTLGKWWQLNGFGPKGDAPGGTGELVAAYLNHNDLGFGRDMHCLRTGQKVACWVTNYGQPEFGPDTGYVFPSNADLAAGKLGPGATVTMEFTDVPADPGRYFVSFYAYGGGTPSAPRVVDVDLDGSYPKPIPQVCAVCHGGRYDPVDPLAPTVDELDFGASFREWDLPSLRYPLGRETSQLTPAELQVFRDLNERIRDHTAPSLAIAELLDGWYGPSGSPKPGPAPDLSFVPPGFFGPAQTALYEEVVAPSCRTCHIARDQSQDLNVYSGELDIRRGAIESLVCGQAKSMPNARLTFNAFWWSTDPHRPVSLAAWDDGSVWTPAIGTCE